MSDRQEIIPRTHYIEKIKPFMDVPVIKVLTGQRRVGKSYLLLSIGRLIAEKSPDKEVLYFTSESEETMKVQNAEDLLNWVRSKTDFNKSFVLLADEIQEIENFSDALRILLAKGTIDIYCTGSNAEFLSRDILGVLSGRAVEFPVFPLSWREFKKFHKLEDNDETLTLYLKLGGMPFLRNLPLDEPIVYEYLKNVYAGILYRDIVHRRSLRNTDLLERIITFLADNIGSRVSSRNIANFLKNQKSGGSVSAVVEYLKHVSDSGIVQRISRSDLEGKKIFEIGEKYYFTDLGLRHSIHEFRGSDMGKIVENAVCLHLLQSGWKVYTGEAAGKEIDFVCKKHNKKMYVQAVYLIPDEKTAQREFGNLLAISDAWPKVVVSMDPLRGSQEGIPHTSLREFLNTEY
ncbi:MAG: ATP-binding protein [Spirochaetaceae bacterium]